MYFRCLNHTESQQIGLEATPKGHLAPPATCNVGSRHLCHFGCSSILPPDLTAKMTAPANIKQSSSPIPNKLINSTVIAFVSVTISKKEIECDPAKYWRRKHQASSPPEGSLTYNVQIQNEEIQSHCLSKNTLLGY